MPPPPKLAPLVHAAPMARIRSRPTATSHSETAWAVVGELGAVLAIIGAVDIALAWYPFAFGNPEWEFGTVTTTLDGMPVLALGLALALGSALFLGKRILGRAVAVVFAVVGVALLGMALLYLTTLPIAWRSVSETLLQQGLLKAITKTMVQAVLYPAVFLGIAVQGWRRTVRPPAPPVA